MKINETPEFITCFAPTRSEIWPIIAAYFESIPSHLSELLENFLNRLTARVSSTSSLSGAFDLPQVARVVYLPLWIIDAYQHRGLLNKEAKSLQENLFISAFLGFCAVRIQDDIIDNDQPDTGLHELLLSNLFTNEAIRRLSVLFPGDSQLWSYYDQYWLEYTSAVSADHDRDQEGLTIYDLPALRMIGQKASLLKIYTTAVCLSVNRVEDITELNEMMDYFNTGVQLINDFQSLSLDAHSGHYTAPLAHWAMAAGYGKGTFPSESALIGLINWSQPDLGLFRTAGEQLESARLISSEFPIPHLTDCISACRGDLDRILLKFQLDTDIPAWLGRRTEPEGGLTTKS